MSVFEWKTAYEVLSTQYEALSAKYEELRFELAAARTQLLRMTEDRDACKATIERFRTENEALHLAVVSWSNANSECHRDIADLKADLVMADQVNQGLHAKLHRLKPTQCVRRQCQEHGLEFLALRAEDEEPEDP